jgi:hypothetical protein
MHMYFYALFIDAVSSLDYKIPRVLNDKIGIRVQPVKDDVEGANLRFYPATTWNDRGKLQSFIQDRRSPGRI